MWPWLNISSTSSNDRPTVSGYMKQTWRNAAKLGDPKIKQVFQAIVLRPGGTANARAVFNARLDAWRKGNDDDHEYRGNLRTHCSKSHGFSTDFQRVLSPRKWSVTVRPSNLSASKRLVHTSSTGGMS